MENTTEQLDEVKTQKDEMQLVSFSLGDEEFGFDIMDIQEIIRPPDIARVPLTPEYVDGVANLRGTVLPIVDMRTRFGMERVDETDRTRLLVIDLHGQKTGLRVDRVRQVDRISASNMEPPPSVIGEVSSEYLDGVVKLEDGKRIIIVLNAVEVCKANLEQIQAAQARAEGSAVQEQLNEVSDQATQDITQMVTFKVAREEYAFPIDKVREILRVKPARQIPEAPSYLLGVLTVRGKLLPIVDLRLVMNQPLLADELRACCERLRQGYGLWKEALVTWSENPEVDAPKTHAPEKLRHWLSQVSSSSEELTECITHLRASNEKAQKTVADFLNKNQDAEAAASAFKSVVAPLLDDVIHTQQRFEDMVAGAIAEDQRIVVVDTNGTLLGLVVDHVNEVLNVPNECTDPAPQLSDSQNAELAGIAKLNDGERLIMILDSGKLLQSKDMQVVEESLNGNGDIAVVDKNEEGQKKREMDEQLLVTFKLGAEEFGVPIAQIREIDRYTKITRIPRVPAFVEGVTNLRGEVIPVINLRSHFAMPAVDTDDRTRIIIVDLDGTKTGLRVDSVSQVLNIANRDVEPPPKAVDGDGKDRFISGIAKVDDGKRMIVFLDVESILHQSRTKAEAKAAEPAKPPKQPVRKNGSRSRAKSTAKKEIPDKDSAE